MHNINIYGDSQCLIRGISEQYSFDTPPLASKMLESKYRSMF